MITIHSFGGDFLFLSGTLIEKSIRISSISSIEEEPYEVDGVVINYDSNKSYRVYGENVAAIGGKAYTHVNRHTLILELVVLKNKPETASSNSLMSNHLEYRSSKPANIYTVTFNANGGAPSNVQRVASGGVATLPPDPTRNGYAFDGWYTDVALVTPYNFATQPTANLNVYAKWLNTSGGKYLVTFVTNGGTSVASRYVDDGELVGDAPTSRAGFTFGGWYLDSQLSQPFDLTDDKVVGDIFLYAAWNAVASTSIFGSRNWDFSSTWDFSKTL